jgi:hypothetical protein
LIKETNLHQKSWNYDSTEKRYGIRISQFKKDPIEIPMVLKFKGRRTDIVDTLNKFYDITEYDILQKSPGKLYFNDWYLECFILEDSTEPEEESYGVAKEITAFAPYPFWIRENRFVISPNDDEIIGSGVMTYKLNGTISDYVEIKGANIVKIKNFEKLPVTIYSKYYFFLDENKKQLGTTKALTEEIEVLPEAVYMTGYIPSSDVTFDVEYELIKRKLPVDYPYDFPYDFLSNKTVATINNEGLVSQNCRIIIYGPVVNPMVNIGDNSYFVSCSVEEGETLQIDTKNKTIQLRDINNELISNEFSNREPRTDFFKKIPTGNSEITWDNTFEIEVIMLEERSTPKWT